MRTELFFASAGDERGTPQAFFDELNAEFHFDIDLAASKDNAKCETYFGFGGVAEDALEQDWCGLTGFLNPPYSVAGAFVKKAREEADKGATVVMLLPVRTDNKWWHGYVWDINVYSDSQIQWLATNTYSTVPFPAGGHWRNGVDCRFVPGRLQFELNVPLEMRAIIKGSYHEALALGPRYDEDEWQASMVEITGLPKMAIEGILANKPDEDLLTSAPFPSCVVIFRKAS